MKQIYIKDIIKICNAELLCGTEAETLTDVTRDTREIKQGDTYIGFKGEHNDGNLLYGDALEKGAKICILQKSSIIRENALDKIEKTKNRIKQEIEEKYKNASIILVEDTTKALQEIASFKRDMYDIPAIGVTGSVGKTSTKDIIASVMSKKFNVLKTLGNYNNQIGLPLTALRLKDENAMVVEMGMNMPNEISILSKIAKPTVAVITNVGTAHIGNLGSRENILKAKLEILEGSKKQAVIINNDNDLLHKWYEENKENYNIKTYGIKEKSNVMAKEIKLEENNSTFTCKIDDEEEKIKVPVGGEHFVLNALCAITVGEVLKIEEDKIKVGIESFELTKKRMDIIELKNGIKIINDAYNASLESMKASLRVLSEYKERKIAVLGDMFELGEFSEELHKKVGEEVVKNKIDILIACGENAKYIADVAKEKMDKENIYYLENKEEIEPLLQEIVKNNDVILFKASNGMGFYKIVERLVESWKK